MLFEYFYILEWAIRLVMLVVVPRKRSPTSAAAWLLVILLFPLPGLIVFTLFGVVGTSPKRRQRLEEVKEALHKLLTNEEQHLARHIVLPEHHQDISFFVQLLGQLPAVRGSRFDLMVKAEDFFDRLVEDIDQAQDHVHLLFYIFMDDKVGRRIGEALSRAAERGVTCRLLADGMGSRPFFKKYARELRRNGVDVRQALPVHPLKRYSERLDMRNHRKIVVIDGTIAYTGSQNLVDPSYGHDDPALIWRDLMARLTGPIVIELQALLVSDWFSDTQEMLAEERYFPPPVETGTAHLQLLPSGPAYDTQTFHRLIVSALYEARERVMITTPYLVPDEPLMQAIEVARLRGVEVELIVPKQSDQVLVGAAARSYYEPLLKHGVSLYRYTDGLLHAKTMVVDGAIAFFGSSNFDIRSFAINFEINLILYGADEVGVVRTQVESYRDVAELLTLDTWMKRSAAARAFDNIARLLSPML